jgi:shikimate dehydrogenase
MQLSGSTLAFAVCGHPIGHTLSPAMHNSSFRALGLDAIYLAFDVHPDRLMTVLPAMADLGFRGVNLTVPLKEVAFRGLTQLDDSARKLGAVNTVQFTPAGLVGHNTDGDGFLAALHEAFGAAPAGRAVCVLGCGGAGRAVAITCAAAGAAELVLTDLDEARPQRVAAEIRQLFPGVRIRTLPPAPPAWAGACRGTDLVLQCTPVGMQPTDAPLLSGEAFRAGQMAFDLVYMHPETAFMRTARAAGARVSNGLGMLLHQGARAFTIWTGREAAVAAMRQALEDAVYRRTP